MKYWFVWLIVTLALLVIYWALLLNNVEAVLAMVRGLCVGACISKIADKCANWVTRK